MPTPCSMPSLVRPNGAPMPRMLKLSLPARPVAPSAAPKRAGWRWTLTPGSKRTRSRMSVTSSSAICSSVLTLTVTGRSSAFTAVRVAVTTIWFLRASQYSPSLSCAKAGAVVAASARPSALPAARRLTDGNRWLVNFLPLIALRLTRNSCALGAQNPRVKMLLRIVLENIARVEQARQVSSGTILKWPSDHEVRGRFGRLLQSRPPCAAGMGGGSAER